MFLKYFSYQLTTGLYPTTCRKIKHQWCVTLNSFPRLCIILFKKRRTCRVLFQRIDRANTPLLFQSGIWKIAHPVYISPIRFH